VYSDPTFIHFPVLQTNLQTCLCTWRTMLNRDR